MRSRARRPPLTITVSALVMLAAIGGLVLLSDRTSFTPPQPAPARLAVEAAEVRVVPDDVPASRRATATRDLSKSIKRLYRRAFIEEPKDAGASPSPSPPSRLRGLITKPALAALKRSPRVFDAGDLRVFEGTVRYSGLVTFGAAAPIDALLEIDFVARAAPPGATGPIARVHQKGTVLMKRTASGWLLDGFDLRFDMRPNPTPAVSPR